jgi:hypothetical protein
MEVIWGSVIKDVAKQSWMYWSKLYSEPHSALCSYIEDLHLAKIVKRISLNLKHLSPDCSMAETVYNQMIGS